MKRVSSREARSNFSQLLEEAAAGAVIQVTRRGKVLAQIGPAQPAKFKRLPSMAAFRASIRLKGEPASKTLARMRDEARF